MDFIQLADGTEVVQCEGRTYAGYRQLNNYKEPARCTNPATWVVDFMSFGELEYFCGVHARKHAAWARPLVMDSLP